MIVRHLLQPEAIGSRRALLGGLACLGSVLALGGCADLAATAPRFDASALSVDPTLLVATTRKPVNGGRAKPWFGPERASTPIVARAKLVPPGDSRLSLAAVGLADWRIDEVEPVSGEVSDLLAQAGGGGDVLIYVHGFKQTFETAVLDAAHLSDAIKFRGRTMALSWPSKAGLFDYAYDRDSAVFSRDDFEHVLSSIVSAPGARRDFGSSATSGVDKPDLFIGIRSGAAAGDCWRVAGDDSSISAKTVAGVFVCLGSDYVGSGRVSRRMGGGSFPTDLSSNLATRFYRGRRVISSRRFPPPWRSKGLTRSSPGSVLHCPRR